MFGSKKGDLTASPMRQTKAKVLGAISSARACIVPHQTKLNESQILIENASQLQSAANAFEEELFNFNEKRSTKVIDQLCDTNAALEETLSAFCDYTNALTSTKSSTVKTVVTAISPLLPPLIYAFYESMKPSPTPAVEEPLVDMEEKRQKEADDYLLSFCGFSA